jgi:hypothetical protein
MYYRAGIKKIKPTIVGQFGTTSGGEGFRRRSAYFLRVVAMVNCGKILVAR